MSAEFWVVDGPMMVGPTAFAEPEGARYGEPPKCPVCSRPIGPRPWLEPRKVRLRSGTKTDKPGDAITGPGIDSFLASDAFRSAFEVDGLTGLLGWEPVTIVNWPGPPYWLAVLPTPTVRADFTRMEIHFKRSPDCPYCQRGVIESLKGVSVDEETWKGQDVFTLVNLRLLMATDRFKAMLDRHEFTGLALKAAARFIPSFVRQKPTC